jgi:hypothetical protein
VNAIEPMTPTANGLKGSTAGSFAPLNRKLQVLASDLEKRLRSTSLAEVAGQFKTRGKAK